MPYIVFNSNYSYLNFYNFIIICSTFFLSLSFQNCITSEIEDFFIRMHMNERQLSQVDEGMFLCCLSSIIEGRIQGIEVIISSTFRVMI